MNTLVVVAALAGLVMALRSLKTPKAQKIRVPVTSSTRRRKLQK